MNTLQGLSRVRWAAGESCLAEWAASDEAPQGRAEKHRPALCGGPREWAGAEQGKPRIEAQVWGGDQGWWALDLGRFLPFLWEAQESVPCDLMALGECGLWAYLEGGPGAWSLK